MLTIFSNPKPFTGLFKIIQENAIRSWLLIRPKPEIILLGSEKGVGDICRRLKLVHIRYAKTNRYHTPIVSDIFKKAQTKASYRIMMYVNSDVIVVNDIIKPIKSISFSFDSFLASGRRFELLIDKPIDFKDKDWREKTIKTVRSKGYLKGPGWMDYFVFTKGLFGSIPPFALGRTFWDKYLIWKATALKKPVIDMTGSFFAVHQTHLKNKDIKHVWEGIEANNNVLLAGGWSHGLSLKQARYRLDKKRLIKKNPDPVELIGNKVKAIFDKTPFVWPLFFRLRRLKNGL
jgi:hypothetical protein